MRPLLLGMARNDNRRGPPLMPEGGTGAGDRLLKISGMTRDEYLISFRRRNLIPRGLWKASKARLRGYRYRHRLKGRVIVLGKETWKALWLPRMDFFSRIYVGSTEFILVPHPSGRCRCYNDSRIRAKLRRIMRGVE